MNRIDKPSAIAYILDKFLEKCEILASVDQGLKQDEIDKEVKRIKALDDVELRSELEESSKKKFTLKGSRKEKNIAKCKDKKTITSYNKLEVDMSKLKNFKVKGIEYTFGVYCKKVAKPKKKTKKDDKK